ncbi:MAG: hypothetical protein PHN61_08775 [Methanothrix sp.]|nr:hypothetical protein [Methanothrix sp.]
MPGQSGGGDPGGGGRARSGPCWGSAAVAETARGQATWARALDLETLAREAGGTDGCQSVMRWICCPKRERDQNR